MSRRKILAGLAAVAVGAASGLEAKASPLPANDALLLRLQAELGPIVARENAAYEAKGWAATSEAEATAQAVADAAFEEWFDIILRMASIPAEGLTGLAVKAAHACRALEGGDTVADGELADSLKADIARLVPGAVVL